jgi:arylsulfatase A-like enzyme
MPTKSGRANIMFILADDTGHGDFSGFNEGLFSTTYILVVRDTGLASVQPVLPSRAIGRIMG